MTGRKRFGNPGSHCEVSRNRYGDAGRTDVVQLFGASGISNEYPIKYFRDAKVLQIVEGTNQIQRNIISRIMLR